MVLLPTPVRSLYTQVAAQKAYKAQEVNQGVEQTPSVIPNGVDVLEEKREEGDGGHSPKSPLRLGPSDWSLFALLILPLGLLVLEPVLVLLAVGHGGTFEGFACC